MSSYEQARCKADIAELRRMYQEAGIEFRFPFVSSMQELRETAFLHLRRILDTKLQGGIR